MKITRGGLSGSLRQYLENLAAAGLINALLLVPYRLRVGLMGWVFAHLVAPLAGYDKRVINNLAYVCPEIAPSRAKAMAREVCKNTGRALIEIYSGAAFKSRVEHSPFVGAGIVEMEAAIAAGRPIIFSTAHLGNYDVPRAALVARGIDLGALYRPMSNPFFNKHYVERIGKISQPLFSTERRGVAQMLRHLAKGGAIGSNSDVYVDNGLRIDFLGKPAPTATTPAELALKFDALLLPIYGVRRADGKSYEVHVSAPIAHTTPEEMTQALAHDVARMVRENMTQWFWIHRRWNPERQAALDARMAAHDEQDVQDAPQDT